MPTYIAFLRAVNVGKRKYPMAELRKVLTEAGFANVETHIQTGNVRLSAPERSPAKVEAALEKVFEADRSFEVPVVLLTPRELTQVAADVEDIARQHPVEHGHYVSLLKTKPTAELARSMGDAATDDEAVLVRGRAVHLVYGKPYHEAKVSNATVEKRLGVATNRNAKVVRALAEKWGG